MASKLASQLQALAVAKGGSSSSRLSAHPSLLFPPSQAANIDLHAIFAISQTGLTDLITKDGRFEKFEKRLFSLEGSQIDRELQSKEFNEKLNRSIAGFLQLLSNYVMLTSAHQALEYLIRRYKIHVYNVEEVVLCVLPYHETSLFVRIVQLLQIKNSRWQFLETVQTTGAALPRAVLVQRCINDMAILESVCELGISASELASKSKTTISFTSVVLVETLAEIPVVSTELVNKFLPSISRSFKNGVAEEYRIGALMMIGALVNRTTLAPSLIDEFFHELSRAFEKGSKSEGTTLLQLYVMVLIQLVQTQQMDVFPSKSFKIIIKSREFLPTLVELGKIFDLKKFLSLLIQALVGHCFQHEHYERAFIEAVDSLPVANEVVPAVLKLFNIAFGDSGTKAGEAEVLKSRHVLRKLLQDLEKRVPSELDKAIAIRFQKWDGVKGELQQDPVFVFLSDVFSSSLRVPVAETRMSLYLSLDHSQASVREKALKQLSNMASTLEPGERAEVHAVLRETYLRRLNDDDYQVVNAALSADNLVKIVPAERLFQALASIITKCSSNLMKGEKTSASVEKISGRATDILASEFLKGSPEYAEKVAVLFFEHLLQRPLTWQLNRRVLKAAGAMPFFLYADLNKIYEETGFQNDDGTRIKEKQGLWLAEVNGKIVQALANKVSADSSAWVQNFLTLTLSSGAKLLVLLVQLQCFRQYAKGLNITLLDTSLQWLRAEWTAEYFENSLSLPELGKRDYSGWDDLYSAPPRFYSELETDPVVAHIGLLLRALYELIGCLHAGDSEFVKGDDAHLDRCNSLFLLFAGSSTIKIYKPHVDLLLTRLPEAEVFPFLCSFFITEDFADPAFVHVHSLDILASRLQNMAPKSNILGLDAYARLQSLVPPLLVTLASPLQAIRRSGIHCIETLCAVWKKKFAGINNLVVPLSPTWFRKFIKILAERKTAVVASASYLQEFIEEKYNIDGRSRDIEMRDKDEIQSVLMFLTSHALRLPVYGQRVLLEVVRGMAGGAEMVRETHQRCKELVERRRLAHLNKQTDAEHERLTPDEVQLLQILCQMYTPSVSAEVCDSESSGEENLLATFYNIFQVEGGSLEDPAVLQPTLVAVKCLTSSFYDGLSATWQDTTFQALLSLSTASVEDIRAASREALKNIKISATTVSRHLDYVLEHGLHSGDHERKRKRRKASEEKPISLESWPTKDKLLSSTSSILELLVWKTEMDNREVLLSPLFKLLKGMVGGVWPRLENNRAMEEDGPEGQSAHAAAVLNAQHLTFMVLENIIRSFADAAEKKDWSNQDDFDIDTVVTAVSQAKDGTTRNHALALLTSLGKLIPDAVLRHVLDILIVIGDSIVTQDDAHSHQIVHQLLAAIVPGWLTAEKDATAVLQVFVSTLPRIPSHRRLSVITNLLRIITEEEGLHLFLFLLLQRVRSENGMSESAASHELPSMNTVPSGNLELDFAVTLCRQYPRGTRLPAMVKLLDVAKFRESHSDWTLQQLATHFVADQLRQSELHAQGQVTTSSDSLQRSFVDLMEETLQQLTTVKINHLPAPLEKGVRDAALSVLDGLALVMPAVDYLRGLSSLMKHSNADTRRRVLRLYISKLKTLDRTSQSDQPRKKRVNLASSEGFSLSEASEGWQELRINIVKDITDLVSGKGQDKSIGSELAAIEALKVSAEKFAEDVPELFASSLPAVVTHFSISVGERCSLAVQCVTTILDKLGPRALPALPETASAIFDIAAKTIANADDDGKLKEKHRAARSELPGLILDAVEIMLNKLGAFLTPYLQNILDLIILRPQLLASSKSDILAKAGALRTLLPTKISARVLLDPLLSVYESATETSDDATCALFGTLATVTATADRSFVAAHHGKIFEFCLTAFDLRSKKLGTLESIAKVETALISAVVALVMKLSETTFKPLFVRLLEWAESDVEVENGVHDSQHVNRSIVFYKLVNQLITKLRSVFVPYLQYMLNGCLRHLAKRASSLEIPKPAKKKMKHSVDEAKDAALNSSEWYLRQLVLSYLHQCFLYDNVGVLDSTRFQLLLTPVVSQLKADPPSAAPILKQDTHETEIPSVEEVDDVLVDCLGQMALTAGTDLLWKPLNHEVLMCTRLEKSRTRLLGLRVIKFLAEHLKEEYLVLVPETIPFLAELLEDSDLAVVSKTQEVVKTLEDLSGEDLTQYF